MSQHFSPTVGPRGPHKIETGIGVSHYSEMYRLVPYFQELCQQMVSTLTEEHVRNFMKVEDDASRIKFFYKHAKGFPIVMKPSGKSRDAALMKKDEANGFFRQSNFSAAIKSCNKAIAHCPQDTDENLQLLAVLYANRSAIFFEQKEYKKCCTDAKVALSMEYPRNLRCKVYMRLARCYTFFEEYNRAIKYCLRAKSYLSEGIPQIEDINKCIRDIERKKIMPSTSACRSDVVQSVDYDNEEFTPNNNFPSANILVEFVEHPLLGRFARAAEDIPLNTIIVKEPAHASFVSFENALLNCAHCIKSIVDPIPCATCAYVVFCSLNCKNAAKKYHRFECAILPTLYESGVSINCLMALRIITQKHFQEFWRLKDALSDPNFSDSTYDPQDYKRVYYLCNHSHIRPKGEFVHYSFMAIFLLRLLKRANYFPHTVDDQVCPESECYIGSLILRNIQLLQFNAHELFELRNCAVEMPGDLSYKSCHVGGALYPTLALFNHSCEPSIIRYNNGASVVTRSIKVIKKGDTIYENYGPIYSTTPKDTRQKSLKERYWFDCKCVPCEENWPLFEQMSEDDFRLKCDNCNGLNLVKKSIVQPICVCTVCGGDIDFLKKLSKLITVDAITSNAERAYLEGDFSKASVLFYECLPIYFTHMIPPLCDLIKIQQRVRTSLIHKGNTEAGYKNPTTIIER